MSKYYIAISPRHKVAHTRYVGFVPDCIADDKVLLKPYLFHDDTLYSCFPGGGYLEIGLYFLPHKNTRVLIRSRINGVTYVNGISTIRELSNEMRFISMACPECSHYYDTELHDPDRTYPKWYVNCLACDRRFDMGQMNDIYVPWKWRG